MSRVHSLIDLGCATFYSIIPFHGEYYGDLFLFPLEYILLWEESQGTFCHAQISQDEEAPFVAYQDYNFFYRAGNFLKVVWIIHCEHPSECLLAGNLLSCELPSV